MPQYIEIKDGVSVKMDDIVAVVRGSKELTSIVHTQYRTYDSTFPYEVLLELLQTSKEESGEIKDILQKQLNIQKEIGTFAG